VRAAILLALALAAGCGRAVVYGEGVDGGNTPDAVVHPPDAGPADATGLRASATPTTGAGLLQSEHYRARVSVAPVTPVGRSADGSHVVELGPAAVR